MNNYCQMKYNIERLDVEGWENICSNGYKFNNEQLKEIGALRQHLCEEKANNPICAEYLQSLINRIDGLPKQ